MAEAGGARRMPLRGISLATLVLLLAVVGVAVWGTLTGVRNQEQRLLRERTAEVALSLGSSVSSLQTALASLGAVARATRSSPSAFQQAASAQVTGAQNPLAVALLRQAGDGYVVVASAGKRYAPGDRVTGVRAQTMLVSSREHMLAATPVLGGTRDRAIGFALGAPRAPAGMVVYQEAALGPTVQPPQSDNAAYAELQVVLYAVPRADPSQVLVATTASRVLHGTVRSQRLKVGATTWLVAVSPRGSLVGRPAAAAPWLVLGFGLLVAALLVAVVETAVRRRDLALELYRSEHQVAETMQRSLLPTLPDVTDVRIAARYLAGGEGQAVGGDWFDVFETVGGCLGVAIGDVIGHDLAAATAMSQIRSALRAYAWQGDDPSNVLEQLDRLVDNFALAQLVTVVYGVLDVPDADGSRIFRFANAGHLSPMVLDRSGEVRVLNGVSSLIIGLPDAVERDQASHRLEAGTTLLLFTDGLVELPGRSIDESLSRLGEVLAGHDPASGPESLCDRVLSEMTSGTLRDDVALLALQLA